MDDVNTFFISKELTGKKYPFAASPGKMTGLFECFELFCLNAEDTINTIIRYN